MRGEGLGVVAATTEVRLGVGARGYGEGLGITVRGEGLGVVAATKEVRLTSYS